MKINKKCISLLFVISLANNTLLFAEDEVDYKLLYRYDDEFEQRYYKKNLKHKLEKDNQENNSVQIIRQPTDYKEFYKEDDKVYVFPNSSSPQKSNTKTPIVKKSSKYEGIYKIGTPYVIGGKTYYPREQPNYKEIGYASWYGEDFHNLKTANGETYDMNDYTAAHPTLPMPSVVRITNLENGKSIKVRINDRGPFIEGRIIDVSKKVAKKLDFHEKGLTKVKVEFLPAESEELLIKYGLK